MEIAPSNGAAAPHGQPRTYADLLQALTLNVPMTGVESPKAEIVSLHFGRITLTLQLADGEHYH